MKEKLINEKMMEKLDTWKLQQLQYQIDLAWLDTNENKIDNETWATAKNQKITFLNNHHEEWNRLNPDEEYPLWEETLTNAQAQAVWNAAYDSSPSLDRYLSS